MRYLGQQTNSFSYQFTLIISFFSACILTVQRTFNKSYKTFSRGQTYKIFFTMENYKSITLVIRKLLCESIYLKNVLNCFKIIQYKPASIPINSGVANFLLLYDKKADREKIKLYQSFIRSFIWPAVHIHANIACTVGKHGCYCNNWGHTYFNPVNKIFRYLLQTLELETTFSTNSKDKPVSYTNFDYTRFIKCEKLIAIIFLMLCAMLWIWCTHHDFWLSISWLVKHYESLVYANSRMFVLRACICQHCAHIFSSMYLDYFLFSLFPSFWIILIQHKSNLLL